MNIAVILCTVILFLSFSPLNASEVNLFQPFSTPTISYDATAKKIEKSLYPSRQAFAPLPKTLHELYTRNNTALARHASLHGELFRVIQASEDAKTILGTLADYGIGILYAPNKHLITTHQGIYGTGLRITTSLESAYQNPDN
ncbi:MAG TPA: hypothetical protein DIC42_00390 [Holosporales bacterium]|nr:hypothetical protein [Holosporales bacterium]